MEKFRPEANNKEITKSERIALFEKKKSKLSEYLNANNERLDYRIEVVQPKIRNFEEKILTAAGYDAMLFLFWHKLIGSTVPEDETRTTLLDTPNGDIEKFVDELLLEIAG